MARRYAPRFGLAVSSVPLDLQVPPVSVVWSARTDRDPAAGWRRAQIDRVLAGTGA